MESWFNAEQTESITGLSIWDSAQIPKYYYCNEWVKVFPESNSSDADKALKSYSVYLSGYSPIIQWHLPRVIETLMGRHSNGELKEIVTCKLDDTHCKFRIPKSLKSDLKNFRFKAYIQYKSKMPLQRVYCIEKDIRAFCADHGLPDVDDKFRACIKLAESQDKPINTTILSIPSEFSRFQDRIDYLLVSKELESKLDKNRCLEEELSELRSEIERLQSSALDIPIEGATDSETENTFSINKNPIGTNISNDKALLIIGLLVSKLAVRDASYANQSDLIRKIAPELLENIGLTETTTQSFLSTAHAAYKKTIKDKS